MWPPGAWPPDKTTPIFNFWSSCTVSESLDTNIAEGCPNTLGKSFAISSGKITIQHYSATSTSLKIKFTSLSHRHNSNRNTTFSYLKEKSITQGSQKSHCQNALSFATKQMTKRQKLQTVLPFCILFKLTNDKGSVCCCYLINEHLIWIKVKLYRKSLTWVASSGASGTVDNLETFFEDGRKRKCMIDTTRLDFTIQRDESTGDGARGGLSGGEVTIRYKGWRHC